MYYLQSRYYDPETGRFINADALTSTGQGVLGNNMFAYCLNNPIVFCDPDGFCSYQSSLGGWVDCGKADCSKSKAFLPHLRNIEDITEKLLSYMDQNVEILKNYKENHSLLETWLYFIINVRDEGPLDIKLQGEWKFEEGVEYVFKGRTLRFDAPGNINYGYVGGVLFSEDFLCFGAGINQISKYGFTYGDITTWFDDPRDTEMIKYGYSLYKERYQ